VKRPRPRTLVLIGLAVVLLGASGGFTLWLNSTPPALGPHPADVYRLVVVGGERGRPAGPSATVPLPGGRAAYLTLYGPDAQGVNSIGVTTDPDGDAGTSSYRVHAGSRVRSHGLDITVLHVWNEPLRKHDAVDLKAIPTR
jgi:hypothetical protein